MESLLYNILTTSFILIILYVPHSLLPILLSPVTIYISIILFYSLRLSATLADHINNDRLIDLAHRRPPTSHTPPVPPISISRQRSCSKFRRLDEHDHKEDRKKIKKKSSKENQYHRPAGIRRTSSGSAWALSAGRRWSGSPPPLVDVDNARPAVAGLRSFSNLRPPPSPGKGSMGLDLMSRKKSGSPTTTLTPSSYSFGNGSPRMATGEAGHQLKMAHNRLMQWRFVNARSEASRRAKGEVAQSDLIGAWAALSKLQTSVEQKQLQLHKEKLGLKINTILSSQVKVLDRWNDTERQHLAALSTTRDSLQSVVCRLPLIEGAKVDPQTLSDALRQENDLTSTIKTTVGIFSPMVEKTVPLLSELAQVVSEEKSLLEEASELLSLISSFQLQEESLKCHLIQLNSVRYSREHLQARNAITTA